MQQKKKRKEWWVFLFIHCTRNMVISIKIFPYITTTSQSFSLHTLSTSTSTSLDIKNFFFSVFKSAVSHFSKHRQLYSVQELPTRFEHWTRPRGIAAHREDHCRTTNLCPASIGLVSMVSYAMACTI